MAVPAAMAWLLVLSPVATAQPAAPPNLVVINERLTTSGQPSREWLQQLKAQGFGAVVYLAPASVPDAVQDEPSLVSRQGLLYVNIPIRFDGPAEGDFDTFVRVMSALAPLKVLVHCQANMRASSMVFLHRVIVGTEDPGVAYESVSRVWSPDGPWKRFIEQQLQKHQIAFEPY